MLELVSVCPYLGVFLVSARTFKFSWDNSKAKFYRSFNAVFGRLGRNASCELFVHLLSLKCMRVLLYALKACIVNNSDIKNLQHPMNIMPLRKSLILNQMMLHMSVR